MREKPIIFSGEMVRAILDGRKTVTRRVVRKPESLGCVTGHPCIGCDCESIVYKDLCPFGQPGDRLWVRENFLVVPTPECSFGEAMRGAKLTVFYHDGRRLDLEGGVAIGPGVRVCLAAADYSVDNYGRWRPPIFMPRWASRITLEVADVRVERLQEIADADVLAEGVRYLHMSDRAEDAICRRRSAAAQDRPELLNDPAFATRCRFAEGWDRLNAKRGYSWESNPWVWRVEFRRLPEETQP